MVVLVMNYKFLYNDYNLTLNIYTLICGEKIIKLDYKRIFFTNNSIIYEKKATNILWKFKMNYSILHLKFQSSSSEFGSGGLDFWVTKIKFLFEIFFFHRLMTFLFHNFLANDL